MHIFIELVEQAELEKVEFVLPSLRGSNNLYYKEYKD
jgi:hypothetical protein